MLYKIIIFMTSNLLRAVDISNNGECEIISIDGNTELEYKKNLDIEQFCEYLKEVYNIEKFSELDISVLLVKAGAREEDITYLYNLLKEVSDKNIVGAEKIIPFVISAQGLVKQNSTLMVNIMNSFYKTEMDNQLNLRCTSISYAKDSMELTGDMFQIFFDFKGISMKNDEEELAKKEKENLQKEQKYLEKEKQLKEDYEKEIAKLKGMLECSKNELAQLRHNEELNKKQVQELEQLKKNAKRSVCCFEKCMSYVHGTRKIKFLVEEGSIVQENQKIAEMYVNANFSRSFGLVGRSFDTGTSYISGESITINTGGRLFYLIKNGREGIEEGDAVAIIGDLSDTKEDVMNWYNSIKGNC